LSGVRLLRTSEDAAKTLIDRQKPHCCGHCGHPEEEKSMTHAVACALATMLVCCSGAMAHDPGDPLLDVTGGTTIEPRARMVQVARDLLASTRGEPTAAEIVARYSREKLLLHPAESPDKRDWMYWPAQRIGLPLKLMSTEQMKLTQELLWSLVSDYGYAKLLNIMQLENILFWTTGPGYPRGLGDYVLVFFGEPSATEPWSWRFEGHHVSLSIAVTPDGVSLTPSFLGANPSNYQTSPLTGVRTLRLLEDLAKTLINSMSDDQRAVANVQGDPEFNALSASFGIETFEDAPFDLYGARFLLPESKWENWKEYPGRRHCREQIDRHAEDAAGSAVRPDFEDLPDAACRTVLYGSR